MNIKDFAEKFIKAENEAFQKGNFEPLKAIEDPNIVYHASVFPEMVGHEAHKQFILGISQAFSNMQREYKYLVGDGNLFALSFKMTGTFTGQIPGFPPPTGKEVTTNSLILYHLKKEKIYEAWMNGTMTGLT